MKELKEVCGGFICPVRLERLAGSGEAIMERFLRVRTILTVSSEFSWSLLWLGAVCFCGVLVVFTTGLAMLLEVLLLL